MKRAINKEKLYEMTVLENENFGLMSITSTTEKFHVEAATDVVCKLRAGASDPNKVFEEVNIVR